MNKIDKTKLIEWAKEGSRWIALFILAWFTGETLKQIGLVPEVVALKVWVFTYVIPVRALVIIALTGLSRFVDKLLHAKKIQTPLDLKWIT